MDGQLSTVWFTPCVVTCCEQPVQLSPAARYPDEIDLAGECKLTAQHQVFRPAVHYSTPGASRTPPSLGTECSGAALRISVAPGSNTYVLFPHYFFLFFFISVFFFVVHLPLLSFFFVCISFFNSLDFFLTVSFCDDDDDDNNNNNNNNNNNKFPSVGGTACSVTPCYNGAQSSPYFVTFLLLCFAIFPYLIEIRS